MATTTAPKSSTKKNEGFDALKGLKKATKAPKVEQAASAEATQQLDAFGRAYATGRRKNAIARVWLKRGTGLFTINGREFKNYFPRPVLRMLISQPIESVNRTTQYDVVCTVTGGGSSGQAGAVRHGISRALCYFEPALRATLKAGDFLTRDSRMVERKKYGKAGARRSYQFSKR